ncbi:hypothetical protein D3C85_1374110 [compost metagenome]
MPVRITVINRIPQAVPIRIQPALAKRAQTVRAVKAHQYRVEGAIAIAQYIIPGHRIRRFAIESKQAEQGVSQGGAMAVG